MVNEEFKSGASFGPDEDGARLDVDILKDGSVMLEIVDPDNSGVILLSPDLVKLFVGYLELR